MDFNPTDPVQIAAIGYGLTWLSTILPNSSRSKVLQFIFDVFNVVGANVGNNQNAE